MDQLADVCNGSDMFPEGSVLPVTLRKWTSSASSAEDLISIVVCGACWNSQKLDPENIG